MKNLTPAQKQNIEKNWKWCQDYWKRKSKELKLESWKFVMNHTKTTLATCNYTQKKICISSYFLRGNAANPSSMRNAILHEAAHALAGHQHSHNGHWKKIANKIGCDGQKYGIMDKPKANYLMFCPKSCFRPQEHIDHPYKKTMPLHPMR